MKISMVITTQGDRVFDFTRFIVSLQSMSYSNFEVILIDQSQDITIQTILKELTIEDKIKYIKSEKSSLSKARNIGLKKASGDIVCFPDDDCWYSEDVVKHIIELFLENEHYNCICANVYDPYEEKYYGTRRESKSDKIFINQLNVFKYPISVGIFIRKSIIGEINFDERLGAGALWGSGEETDLILRLLKRHENIIYIPKLLIFHPICNGKNWDMVKYYNYGKGFGATIRISFRRKQYLTLIELVVVLFRSFVAFILFNLKDKNKSLNYLARIRGIFVGFLFVE